MNIKQKNIPLLVMSLLFVGAITYGGFQIASAQKGEFSENHPLVSRFLGQTEKRVGSTLVTEKVAPKPSAEVISRGNTSEAEGGIKIEETKIEGTKRGGEQSGERSESIRSERSRHDDDEGEGDEGDDDESWTSPTQATAVTTPVPPSTPTTPSVTPPATTITLAQVAQHSTTNDCWMVIQGKVYNVSTYIGRHPGGNTIVSGCGVDATTMFNAKGGRGHSQSAWNLLPQFFVGALGA
jgi:cytochrome b involved in lipid metabolism